MMLSAANRATLIPKRQTRDHDDPEFNTLKLTGGTDGRTRNYDRYLGPADPESVTLHGLRFEKTSTSTNVTKAHQALCNSITFPRFFREQFSRSEI